MQANTISIAAWFSLAIAILAWIGVVFFGWFVFQMLDHRDALATQADQAIMMQANSARMRALARDTVDERALLDSRAGADALTAVNTIESIGKSAGVELRVSDARPERVVATIGDVKLNAVVIGIRAEGTFSGLMRAVQMLEAMPLPSRIDEMDIARAQGDVPKSGNAIWQMNVRVQLLTTADISS